MMADTKASSSLPSRDPLMKTLDDGSHAEIRDAIRALCAQYPDEYFRRIDEQRIYPESFVNALTQASWLAALMPQ